MRSNIPLAYGKIAKGEKMYRSVSVAIRKPFELPRFKEYTTRGMIIPVKMLITMTRANPVADVLNLKVKRYANNVPPIPYKKVIRVMPPVAPKFEITPPVSST